MQPPNSFIRRVAFRSLTVTCTACTCLLLLIVLAHSTQAAEAANRPDALGSIAGVVTNQDGAPLADIDVSVQSKTNYQTYVAQTDATGAYKVNLVATGIYYIHMRDPLDQYAPQYYDQVNTVGKATEVIVAGNHVTDINATLTPGGHLTGMVFVENEGPAPRGAISVYGQQDSAWQPIAASAITVTGQYTSSALLAGVYRLCAEVYAGSTILASCYGGPTLAEATNITLAAGEIQTNLAITVDQQPVNGEISGQVTADSAPQLGVKVSLYKPDLGSLRPNQPFVYVFTDAAGHYTIGGLSAGRYRVGFSDPAGVFATTFYTGYPTIFGATDILLDAGKTISDINIALLKAGTIQGTVQRTDGGSISHLYAVPFQQSESNEFEPWQALGISAPVDATGHYTLTGLWAGVYRIGICFSPSPCEPQEYYGSKTTIDIAKDIIVEVGKTVSGINVTFGIENPLFFPLIKYQPCDLMCKLVEMNNTTGDFKTFLMALQATGTDERLHRASSYTIFAPTEAAFAALPAGTLEQWLAHSGSKLTGIIEYHIVYGSWLAEELPNDWQLYTVQGNDLTFTAACPLVVNCAAEKVNGITILTKDIIATNGVIHVIGGVLVPPENR